MITAIIIGATGLTGSHLVELLLDDSRFQRVKILGRRSTGISHPKLEEHIIDFEEPDTWKQLVKGDVLFSALGTTLKQAGSKSEQYKVDFTYQWNIAKAAAENSVPVYVLVSAATASVSSGIFYSRMKGELEEAVKQLHFKYIHILQPGILQGERENERIGERAGISIIRFLNKLGVAKKQKPIPASVVAKAMINVSFKREIHEKTYTLLQVFREAEGA